MESRELIITAELVLHAFFPLNGQFGSVALAVPG
jgi:hypothetical protein